MKGPVPALGRNGKLVDFEELRILVDQGIISQMIDATGLSPEESILTLAQIGLATVRKAEKEEQKTPVK